MYENCENCALFQVTPYVGSQRSGRDCTGDRDEGPFETTMATATATSKSNRFSKENNNSARASRLFVHFFAVSAQLRREMTKF